MGEPIPSAAFSRVVPDDLPESLELRLVVEERDMIADLAVWPEGPERDGAALDALRIGLLALRQARGQIDAEAVRREGDRLLRELGGRLEEHGRAVHERLRTALGEYFDPQSGRFSERVQRLVQKDGELEQVLRRLVGAGDSELARTLTAHLGAESPLLRLLTPDRSDGFLRSLADAVDRSLATQRTAILDEFSLNRPESALCRLVREMESRYGKLGDDLSKRIDEVVREFSLDQEGSALSRLLRQVDQAQRTITREFSLDEQDSALARLKREMLGVLERLSSTHVELQKEVRETLARLASRKEEAARTTRHGFEFEDAVWSFVQQRAQQAGDVATLTSATPGMIRNSKVGDCVIELGPDKAAAGARVVLEAKEDAAYSLAIARAEIETARKNRNAQVGIFVFSRRTAPEGLQAFTNLGCDVFVVWDAEDGGTDPSFVAALAVAQALCTRAAVARRSAAADFEALEKAVVLIEQQANLLQDIARSAETVLSGGERIKERARIARVALLKQVAALRDGHQDLRALVAPAE